jgi:hypothetical protein
LLPSPGFDVGDGRHVDLDAGVEAPRGGALAGHEHPHAVLLEGPGGIPGRPEALDDLAVPTVLRDVVLQRLFSLDDDAREILDAAAVIGLVTDDRLLAEVTQRDAAGIARALARAQDVGLLQDEDGRSRFRHALARQVVYESVPAARRRWLHLRTGQALEPGGSPARLAHHYQGPGRRPRGRGHPGRGRLSRSSAAEARARGTAHPDCSGTPPRAFPG